ncbi:2-hydroxyacyl-CoA dehydratase subunit D [Thermodesulfobacteriota bacterium]
MVDAKVEIPTLKAHKRMQALNKKHYDMLDQARAEDKKICWATGQAPTDILLAMDIIPAYPENHAALCGVRKIGSQLCQVAEARDYFPDLCSYARNSLGSCFSQGEELAVAPLPAPDILLAVTMCNTHIKWFEALSRYYDVPLLLLETPFLHDQLTGDEIKTAIKYVYDQLKEMAVFLEHFCGRAFNYDRLQECVSYSLRCGRLFAELLNSAKHKPSPITVFDIFIQLGPMMTLRGFPEAVNHYEELLSEVKQRVSHSISAVGQETYRLYWDNIPVWYKVGWMSRKLASYGACTVSATYPWAWVNAFAELDVERPLESIAETQNFYYQNKGTKLRIDFLQKLIEDFYVDGMLAQVSASCKALVPDQAVIIRETQKLTGVPAVFFEGDMVDERLYSDMQVTQQLEDFMEILAEKKQADAPIQV